MYVFRAVTRRCCAIARPCYALKCKVTASLKYIINLCKKYERLYRALLPIVPIIQLSSIVLHFIDLFDHRAGLCEIGTNGSDSIQVILTVLFTIDIVVNFNVAVYRNSLSTWVVDRREIARLYLWNKYWFPAGLFWVDLLAVFPFDWIIGAALNCDADDVGTLRAIRFLRLLRLYRLVWTSLIRIAEMLAQDWHMTTGHAGPKCSAFCLTLQLSLMYDGCYLVDAGHKPTCGWLWTSDQQCIAYR